MTDFRQIVLEAAVAIFRKQKALAEGAMGQLSEDELFLALDPEANSIAILVKHMQGNMRSRWTGFLTTDGEKPDRNRDSEFVETTARTRKQVMEWWEGGWAILFEALGALSPADLERIVHVRGESMTAAAAILRQVDHYGQHVGQIVLLAKHFRGAEWRSLSIPRARAT